MPSNVHPNQTEQILAAIRDGLDPLDADDQQVIANCHPPGHVNPAASERQNGRRSDYRYNLIAIGAGAAGLVTAGGTGMLGGRAALIERNLLGGDCLNTGCVPSKALIRGARAIYDARAAGRFGWLGPTDLAQVDFAQALERMRQLRARISHHDSVERFQTRYGVDVYLGEARFTGPETLSVAGQELHFARAVIATGGRPAIPAIPGLSETGYLTSESIFNLRQLPTSLIIIGGGPIGCELGQVFRRYGSDVTILNEGVQLLPREDPEVAAVLEEQLRREGVKIHHDVSIREAARPGRITWVKEGRELQLSAAAILVATGRVPAIGDLDLAVAGVRYNADGVLVDDRLRTSNHRIYAAGDVCSPLKLTHAADAMARIVIRNALFFGRRRMSQLVIPRCTYTDPEIAHVGLTRSEALALDARIETITVPFSENDRAILDNEEEGLVSVHYARRSGRLLGGTIVARHAGEMIGELTLAITHGMKIDALAATIHPYPTRSETLRRIGEIHELSSLTSTSRQLIRRWLAWRR